MSHTFNKLTKKLIESSKNMIRTKKKQSANKAQKNKYISFNILQSKSKKNDSNTLRKKMYEGKPNIFDSEQRYYKFITRT